MLKVLKLMVNILKLTVNMLQLTVQFFRLTVKKTEIMFLLEKRYESISDFKK